VKYFFDSPSAVASVDVVKQASGSKAAYIHARDGADLQALAQVQTLLAGHGYLTVPMERSGEAVLEVRRFSSDESLLSQLQQAGAVAGKPARMENNGKPVSWWDWCKHHTYEMCLGLYILGDTSYFKYGVEEQKQFRKNYGKNVPENAYSGIAYWLGTAVSIISTWLRGDQSDDEVKKISAHVHGKFAEKNIAASDNLAQASQKETYDLSGKLKQAFISYPSEIMNLGYAVAGGFLARAAYKKMGIYKAHLAKGGLDAKTTKKLNEYIESQPYDVALGLTTTAAGLYGALMPERAITEEDKAGKNVFEKAWLWFTHKPLSVAAAGYGVSTAIHAKSTLKEWRAADTRREKMDVGLRGGFVVTNLAAEALMAVSSKGHGDGVKTDDTVENSVVAVTAETIATQAPEQQEKLVQEMSAELASPKIMGGNRERITQTMREQVASMKDNPWAKASRRRQEIKRRREQTEPVAAAVNV